MCVLGTGVNNSNYPCAYNAVYCFSHVVAAARDSSVGTATRYVLDGPGIESRCGARFSAPFQTDPGDHPDSYTMGTGSFPGGKAGAWPSQPTYI
jgi:hypothetical protein